ncbi:porin family protein [Flavobacterium sp. Arc3]|uniref:porin family protein n=1 Tax=unclassified Flavobacterium TaxID=196869 RepID=UPI00352CFBD8
MRIIFSFFLVLSVSAIFSQEIEPIMDSPEVKVDSLYREDQFYFGFTYNTLQQKPAGISQSKFSTGLSVGFLRDMPINKERTHAIAAGLGFTYNNYIQNLAIKGTEEMPVYSVIDDNTVYDKNKFTQLLVDLPIEFRWRTSNYESYKFWRIYGGMKFSYVLYNRSFYSDAENKVTITNNKDFNKLLYGIYLSGGYNTINVYAYYGLNSIFKTAEIDGEKVNMKSLNIGIIFYIL